MYVGTNTLLSKESLKKVEIAITQYQCTLYIMLYTARACTDCVSSGRC